MFQGGERDSKSCCAGFDSLGACQQEFAVFGCKSMMRGMRSLLLALTLALAACASIDNVDMTKAEPTCGRGCTQDYNACDDKWSMTPIMRHNECVGAFKACVASCPARHS